MSNIGNIFGNEGWIQSSIDKSRGKTRPGAKRRKVARVDAARRKKLLEEDPLVIKNTTGREVASVTAGTGVLSQVRRRILKQTGILNSGGR